MSYFYNNLCDQFYLFTYAALDSWTSGNHQSYWNFIILTPSHKEYLCQLSDLSLNSYTAAYLAEKIDGILERIEPERISAIVSTMLQMFTILELK